MYMVIVATLMHAKLLTLKGIDSNSVEHARQITCQVTYCMHVLFSNMHALFSMCTFIYLHIIKLFIPVGLLYIYFSCGPYDWEKNYGLNEPLIKSIKSCR